jgi:tetratricopeptide (TPR) repeat protein
MERTIELDPNVALYHVSLGIFYECDGRSGGATEHYAHAIRLSPDLLDSEFFRSLQKRSPEIAARSLTGAEQQLEMMISGNPDVKFQARLAKIELAAGHLQKAKELLTQVINKLPNLGRPRLYLGDIYGREGDTTKMLECYSVALKIDPTDFLIDARMGSYLKDKGDTTEAGKYFKGAKHKWTTVFPEYAVKTALVYKLKNSLPNAVLPQDMLQYIRSLPEDAAR